MNATASLPTRPFLRLVVAIAALAVVGTTAYQLGARRALPDQAPSPPSTAPPAETAVATMHVCPMHPQVRQEPFGTCPICFMELVPVESGGGADSALAIPMSEAAARLANVQVERVARVPVARTIRAFGRVEAPEDQQASISAWTAGRIDRLYVETIGTEVRRGQRLARIYSPELVLAQETLIHAQRIVDASTGPDGERRRATGEAAVRAARTELRLLGIDDAQIDALVADGEADEYVEIRAPSGGTVMARHVQQGDHVQRGTPILELASLDALWVQLELYERDLAHVQPGTVVDVRFPGVAGEPIRGTVAFVDPTIDARRRVARARVVVDNPDGRYRPEMFVEAELHPQYLDERGRPPVSVPASAVLWTGTRSLVYVYDPIESPPVYMPIEVELGERIGDRYVIESGVFPGEQIVVHGAFRIDASLQIRGGASMMQPPAATPAEVQP
jgi:membrane fusion protein, copper/silver efflux system